MGGCSSCLRLLLNEADVKIHVIEPTSVMGGGENADVIAVQPSSATLQVPPLNRPRTPSEPKDKDKDKDKENKDEGKDDGDKEEANATDDDETKSTEDTTTTTLQVPTLNPSASLQIPDSTEVLTIPVQPRQNPSDTVE